MPDPLQPFGPAAAVLFGQQHLDSEPQVEERRAAWLATAAAATP
jgi:hypothetical protein